MSSSKSTTNTASTELLRCGAATALLCLTAAAHLVALPTHMRDAPLIALMIGLAVPVCVSMASWLWTSGDQQAWAGAAALAGALIVAFLVTRTVGLPGFDRTGQLHFWAEGLPALLAECGVLGLASEQWLSSTPRLRHRRDSTTAGDLG